MNTIQLTPELIDRYQSWLTDPKAHNLPFEALHECFEVADTVTAKHILAEQYIKRINRKIPKIIIYVIMDREFGECDGKDENGFLGYDLRLTESKH